MRPCHSFLHREGVLGIGHLVVVLFVEREPGNEVVYMLIGNVPCSPILLFVLFCFFVFVCFFAVV